MPAMPAPQSTPHPRSSALADLLLVASLTVAFFVFAVHVELFERVESWTQRHEGLQLDELPLTLVVLCAGLVWFGWRRLRERSHEMKARLQVEAALLESLRQNRELARQLLRLQEDERHRFARELHDELAQQCVAIRVEAAGIEDEVRGRDLPGVAEGARAIRDTVDHLHAVVRDMLTRLRPPMLDALGLEASLRSLAEAWSRRYGLACSVQVDPCCERLADQVRVALYRVAQEALTNVARHAAATQAHLALAPDPDGQALLLTVDDDGRGMPAERSQRGLGLFGMTERVAILGGSLAVAPSPHGGVRVEVRVPAPRVVPRLDEETLA